MKLSNIVKHFTLITRHRLLVFKLCCKVGIPWRGFVHDLSKYSPTEFFEGAKYYVGIHSPITEAKKDKGYSSAWLHHKGRNKHHPEYWVDESSRTKMITMPYQYAAEMICDKFAAAMIYEGKNFTIEYELNYWKNEREKVRMNDNMKNFVDEVMKKIEEHGIKKGLTKQTIKKSYEKHCM